MLNGEAQNAELTIIRCKVSRRNKDGIEWQTGFALNDSAVDRLLNGKAQKAVTKKRKRPPFSDQRERLPFSER